jgi:sugar O-acyltransferase (sialic acid O-acetyltransferase NeuD family)
MKARSRNANPIFGVYGSGGCGRGVLPVADDMLRSKLGEGAYDLMFVDDAPASKTVNGRRVLSLDEFVAEDASARAVSIAIGDPEMRAKLDKRCREHGLGFFEVIAPNAIAMDDVQIGDGAILSPFVTITSNVRIGRHFHANLYSSVEHDCRIGDFVTFAPGVRCNGNVVIHDHAYLGAGCILRQGKPGSPLEIGEGAIVGMGAVVTKSVPPGVTVVGNPAKPLHTS